MKFFDLDMNQELVIGDLGVIIPLRISQITQKFRFGFRSNLTKEECPITKHGHNPNKLECLECGLGHTKKKMICDCGAGMALFISNHLGNKVLGRIPFDDLKSAVEQDLKFTKVNEFNVRIKREHKIFFRDRKCLHCGAEAAEWLVFEYINAKNGDQRRPRIFPVDKDTVPLTIDHIIPVGKGGPDSHENYQTLCYNCNNSKGDTLPPEIDQERVLQLEARRKQFMERCYGLIGKKVIKRSGNPFRSGLMANRVRAVIDHPQISKVAFVFVEDTSTVLARRCKEFLE